MSALGPEIVRNVLHRPQPGLISIVAPPLGGLIVELPDGLCRAVIVRGELGGGVFGFPSLSFGDGLQQQDGTWWDSGSAGAGRSHR